MGKEQITFILDICFKTATIIIAGVNVFFAIKFFHTKSKKDDDEKEKDRKISWLKTLVLDHNLKHFYEFFNSLEKEFAALKQNALNDTQKQEIDEKIAGHFIVLRRSFIDTLLAVDKTLYDKVLKKMDDYQGIITSSIFDNGINLAHQPKFEEILLNNLTTTKTDVLECLFNYRG